MLLLFIPDAKRKQLHVTRQSIFGLSYINRKEIEYRCQNQFVLSLFSACIYIISYMYSEERRRAMILIDDDFYRVVDVAMFNDSLLLIVSYWRTIYTLNFPTK